MEVTRQEGRGRPSRSRKDSSNKENICPLQFRDAIAADMLRRRSPLPEGFPRSPLQDITHIICPHNIWPDNQDPLTDQVRKKFRKDNSEGICTASQIESNSSWKGLAPCGAHVKFGTKVVQFEETLKEEETSNQSTDGEVISIGDGTKINKHEQNLCIHRDESSNDAISLPNCEIEGIQDANSEVKSKQMGALDTQAHVIVHKEISAECLDDLKQNTSGRLLQTIVGKENHNKRLQQPTQLKKKSSLLMFR